MPKTKKKKTHNKKTRRNIKKKPTKRKVQFGNSFRCVPVDEKNKHQGKIINIDGESMVVIKEKTTF